MDEEGYSIKPEDASNIGKFPDDPWGKKDNFSDSSDSEDGKHKLKLESTLKKHI